MSELVVRSYNRMTPERVARLLWAVSKGYTVTGAAAIAQISRSHVYEWLEDEEKQTLWTPLPWEEGESEPLTNRERYELARQQAIGAHETVVLADALKTKNPAQALRWLQRNSPADWGDRPTSAQNVNLNMDVDMTTLSPDQLRRIADGEDIAIVLAEGHVGQ